MTELHLSSRSRRREGQLVQEDVVRPAEGLVVPGPEGNIESDQRNWEDKEKKGDLIIHFDTDETLTS